MAKSRLSKRERMIHEQFSRYGKNAKEWHRKCALILPQIEREEIWQKLRFKSIYHYAAVVGGMSHHQAREALRVMKHIEDKPALIRVAKMKGINSVSPVATIATKETAGFWANRATEMSVSGLRTYIHETRKSQNVLTSQPANGGKNHDNQLMDITGGNHNNPLINSTGGNHNNQLMDIAVAKNHENRRTDNMEMQMTQMRDTTDTQTTESVTIDLPPELARRLDRLKKR